MNDAKLSLDKVDLGLNVNKASLSLGQAELTELDLGLNWAGLGSTKPSVSSSSGLIKIQSRPRRA